MRRMTCPHCMGVGKVEVKEETPIYLPPLKAKIYRAVKNAPAVINGPRLVDILYADRHDGGPENPLDCIHVLIRGANKQLAAIGEKIKADRRGPGATYRIIKI